MHIKKQTVIPEGFPIKKCPPMPASGKSVWQLEREQEKRLIAEAQKVSTKDLHTCSTDSSKLCMQCEVPEAFGVTLKAG